MTAEAPRPARILVVDDNEANRLVAEGHLSAAGYEVVLAETGERALEMFVSCQPELVLLDVLMPGLDGFATCRLLKKLPGGLDVPVVFLTALADFGSHQRALESGADDFLTKPINRTELLIRVRSLLWVKKLRDELTRGYEIIRSQRDELLRAQRQKAELSELVVHDLKSPLSTILVSAKYLETDSSLSGDALEAAGDVLTSAELMRRMVMNLLDISRSEDGTLVPERTEFDLAALVEEACSGMRRRLVDEGRALELELELAQLKADRDLLQRLLENLLDNAVKYTPLGGTIRVTTRLVPDGVELRVADEGRGIPESERERIFERYARADSERFSHRGSSRGLGLAFCRLAAEVHGGRIWVEPGSSSGTVFCVFIPRFQAPSSEVDVAEP